MTVIGETTTNPENEITLSKSDLLHATAITADQPDACLFIKKGLTHTEMRQRYLQERSIIRHTVPRELQVSAKALLQLFLEHVYKEGTLEVWNEAFGLTTEYFQAEGQALQGSEELLFEHSVVEAYEDTCTRTAIILGQKDRMQPECFE